MAAFGSALWIRPAVAEIERQLVDRVALRTGQVADGSQIAPPHFAEIHLQRGAQQVRVGQSQARVRRARCNRHFHRKIHCFAHRRDLGVAAEDPLDQRRSRARHADDEDRTRCFVAAAQRLHRFRGVVLHHVLHRADVVHHVVRQRPALDAVGLKQDLERLRELADVLQLFRQGKGHQHRVEVAQTAVSPAPSAARRCGSHPCVCVASCERTCHANPLPGAISSTRASSASACAVSFR